MSYTAAGQLTQLGYGNGVTTTHTYDPLTLRLASLRTTGPSGTLQDFAYQFDRVGNVTELLDRVHTGTQSFTYDGLHRLTRAVGSYGDYRYAYDPLGNLLEKEGRSLLYGAGPAGPHAVTSTSDGLTLSYDANGNVTEKRPASCPTTGPCPAAQTLKYDAENRLVEVVSPLPTQSVTLSLRAGWNFVSLPVDVADRSIAAIFGSNLNAITQISRYEKVIGRWQHWVRQAKFDQFTTLESGVGYEVFCTQAVSVPLTGSTVTVASQSLSTGWHLLGATSPTAQAVGAWLSGVSLGRVKKLDASTGTLADTTQAEAGQGYWVEVTAPSTWTPPTPPAQTTRFVYDGDGGRVKQIAGAGTTIFLGQSVEIGPDGKTTKYVFAGSQRIAAKDSTGALRFYHGDHLGSSNVVTDATGQMVELAEHTPFGSLSRREGSANVPQKFTGQRFDASTGLYFYNARYYDPELGRFLQPDPTVQRPGDPQDLNRYTYARNNPVNNIDPSGYGWFKKFWRAIVGVVTTAVAILVPPLAPAMWAVNVGISAATAIQTGNVAGFVGGLVGGAVFGAIGQGIGLGMATSMGQSAYTFLGGAIAGAAEFGLAGFGAGFGGALASGASLRDSFKAGGMGAAVGGAMGAAIQGSYMAEWQDTLHGNSIGQVAGAQGQAALQAGRPGDLAGIATTLRTRTRGNLGLYLHGTNAKGAAGIRASRQLDPWSWVTQPHAIDAMTGKPAMMLNPAEYRAFTGIPSYDKGEFFALIVAPSTSVYPRGLSDGGAPQSQIYGKHHVLPGSPYSNPNR